MTCEICGASAQQHHHRFPQTRANRRVYRKLIDHPANLVPVCGNCHASHAHVPSDLRWSEEEFRAELSRRGVVLPGISKTLAMRAFRPAYA